MPEVLTKKMFGLPRWAWLLILAAAIGVGLYLRHKRSEEENEEGTEGEESPVGVVGSEAVPIGGYNEVGEGGGYYYGEGGGGFINEGVPIEEGEGESHPETVINIGAAPMPSATDGLDAGSVGAESSAGVTGTPCGQKPGNIPNGYKAECVSGRWKLVAKSGQKAPAVSTGGGPPNRKDNKGPSRPRVAVGPAHAVSGGGGGGGAPAVNNSGGVPQNNAQHPAAVNTGNKCVNGGVGGHSAPSGYHLFCQGGYIWRAPNS